jgi:hypothetical protein
MDITYGIRVGGDVGYGKREVVVLRPNGTPDGEPLFTHEARVISADGRLAAAKVVAAVLATQFSIPASAEAVEAKLQDAWMLVYRAEAAAAKKAAGPPPRGVRQILRETPFEVRKEARALLADPVRLIDRFYADLELLGVAGEHQLAMLLYLTGTSRLLPHPLSARVHGASASGKSYLIDVIADLFPAEGVIRATAMSPQSLYHMPEGGLVHKFVVAGERAAAQDEHVDVTKALREMQASGHLSKLMPVKVAGGGIETLLIEQSGPISFLESTTAPKVFAEDANRCLPLATDESPEQTELILNSIAAQYSAGRDPAVLARTRLLHQTVQRLIRPVPVVVPYSAALSAEFPKDRVEARRAVPMIFRALETVALVFAAKRERDGNGAIIASLEDYELVRLLLSAPVARLLDVALTPASLRCFQRLGKWRPAPAEFSTTEARREEKCTRATILAKLAELEEAGAVECVEASHGPKPARWKLTGTPPAQEGSILPTVEQLSK